MNDDLPELDVVTATASQLSAEMQRVETSISAASVLDPRMPDLLTRLRVLRQEIGRREVLMMQGILWSADATPPGSNTAAYGKLRMVKTRNGRGGPGGPGDWDD